MKHSGDVGALTLLLLVLVVPQLRMLLTPPDIWRLEKSFERYSKSVSLPPQGLYWGVLDGQQFYGLKGFHGSLHPYPSLPPTTEGEIFRCCFVCLFFSWLCRAWRLCSPLSLGAGGARNQCVHLSSRCKLVSSAANRWCTQKKTEGARTFFVHEVIQHGLVAPFCASAAQLLSNIIKDRLRHNRKSAVEVDPDRYGVPPSPPPSRCRSDYDPPHHGAAHTATAWQCTVVLRPFRLVRACDQSHQRTITCADRRGAEELRAALDGLPLVGSSQQTT